MLKAAGIDELYRCEILYENTELGTTLYTKITINEFEYNYVITKIENSFFMYQK